MFTGSPLPRRHLLGMALAGAFALTTPVMMAQTASPASAEATDDCGAVLAKADGSNWACSFVDNFDGSSLNRDKWLVQQTVKTGFYSGMTCFVDSNKNVQVTNGELKLTAKRENRRYDCRSPYGGFLSDYTGGAVGVRPELAQAFGRFEVRAKFPSATKAGVHGGFWMYPPKETYGKWPASGEIDVAEWWSSDPALVMPTLHYKGEKVWVDNGYNCRVADPSNYHTYAVEWLTTGFSFFIDGKVCFTRTPAPDAPLVAPQPFDQPFSMILSMGVGPASGTNAVSSSTRLPGTFTVDYAKSWR